METIIDGIRNYKYAITKLEFYSNHFKDNQHEKAPKLIEQILKVSLHCFFSPHYNNFYSIFKQNNY